MQKAGAKKVAIAYSDNAPGNQCYSLTQKPILEELGVSVESFPFTPGSPGQLVTADVQHHDHDEKRDDLLDTARKPMREPSVRRQLLRHLG